MELNEKIFIKMKHLEGMTKEGSTIEQRHEIWKILFNKNMIYDQLDSIEDEIEYLESKAFYFSRSGDFVPDRSDRLPIINIDFETFKKRLENETEN